MAEPAQAATQDAEVLYSTGDHVATITLNRPERMNTISGPMLRQLTERLIEADADRDVRVIVLTGTGRAFCAGLDLSEVVRPSQPGDISNTNAVEVSIHAVSPLLGTGASAAQASVGPRPASAKAVSRRRIGEVLGAVRILSPGHF